MNPSTAFARVLTDELVRLGLRDACLAPGSRSAPLALALAADPRVRLHVRIDERSAAFLALGLARAGGRPVALVCTSGTAAVEFAPAVVEASESSAGLLVLTADRPPELRGTGANQTIDQLKLYGGAVRWFCEVGVPEAGPGANGYWRSLCSRAWAEAAGLLAAPAGPVHLNIALREPLVPDGDEPTGADLAGRPGGAPWTAVSPPVRTPSAADAAWLAGRLAAVERGLVVLGDSGTDTAPLADLGRAAGWPVVAEPSSNARAGPGVVSTAALLLADGGFAAAHVPELVLCAGRVGLSRAVLGLLGAGTELVRVDPRGAWLDPARATTRLLVADPGLLAGAVAACLQGEAPPAPDAPPRPPGPPGSSPWLDGWLAAEEAARAAVDAVLDEDELPSEPRTARDLAAALPDGALLFAGSSMPIRDLDLAMRPRHGLRVLANRGASGIDGLVSSAVGAALAHPGPAAALLGDVSFLYDANGLVLGPDPAQPRPDLVLVVANNDGGGIFSLLPQAGLPGFERVFGTPHGVDLAAVAAAVGCHHTLVARAAELAPAVAAAGPGLSVVEVRTDRAENAALHARLRAAVPAALAALRAGS